MPYDEKLAQRVRTIVSQRGRVSEKRLMGTLGFMVNGSLCCSVGSDGLLIRVQPEEREQLLDEPFVSPMKLGARTMKGFVRVSLEGLRTRAKLSKWLARGLAAGAARANQGRRPRKA
ncbi:MAG TPA: TfoX/Sxy family protein [Polyangiaceae bacterium]|jgi:TfoX/Sxy family transcriptional regulator of competence genes|nr:TfoX/Sxy family protein [Polyangiaceae bacterium]